VQQVPRARADGNAAFREASGDPGALVPEIEFRAHAASQSSVRVVSRKRAPQHYDFRRSYAGAEKLHGMSWKSVHENIE
jgi:hypothetical protein